MSDDLACFPTRVDWEMTQPPVGAQEFPAPLVTSRDGQHDAIPHPDPVDDLASFARGHKWATQIAYSEGWVPHATTGKPLGPKVMWSVRMVRSGGLRAVAVRTDDKWTSLWITGETWQRFATLAAFKERLADVS